VEVVVDAARPAALDGGMGPGQPATVREDANRRVGPESPAEFVHQRGLIPGDHDEETTAHTGDTPTRKERVNRQHAA
jgi:hypothetical protein